MRVWTVPTVVLLAVTGSTSPITLVGSVEPATTTVAAVTATVPANGSESGPGTGSESGPGIGFASGPGIGFASGSAPVLGPPPGAGPARAGTLWDVVTRRAQGWTSRSNAEPSVLPVLPVQPVSRRVDCERVRCVALTFDDGPGPYTGGLLDILAERRVRASFFVVGRMVSEEDEAVLRRMVAEGHELGNHTWNHPQLTRLPHEEVRRELGRTQWLVKRVTGVTMNLMRPPYGLTGPQVAAESRHLGLAQILWNVDTRDWHDRDVSVVAHRAAAAGPGSVVLLHDIHPTTVRAVPHLLDDLAGRGYRFVTLSELYGRRPAPGRRYYHNP
ncbi:polysaccharide deacetylase family protein [Streptosporangium sp. DT93]|uniref:polysaccharide deacetylase family protein n=1 Tax=Streptosporangium sp. DT93 TaxID=3393428 RepID=UPI003CEE318E